MPRGYSKDKYPDMYQDINEEIEKKVMELRADRTDPFKESLPFITGTWARYLRGGMDKEAFLRIMDSLATIWR